MDKYEFNIKAEQIKKLAKVGDYTTAKTICDEIDWRRVSSVSLLTTVADIYEKCRDFENAKEILLLAYEKAPSGKGLLFKLTILALREGNISEAEAYYREYYDLAKDDPRQHILRYLILKEKGAPLSQLIHTLETYNNEELDERWMYELAEMYREAERHADCVNMCDTIALMFGVGAYVDKALELKTKGEGAPLSPAQLQLVTNREKYERQIKKNEEEEEVQPIQRVSAASGYVANKANVIEENAQQAAPVQEVQAEENEEPAEAPAEEIKAERTESAERPAPTGNYFVVARRTPEECVTVAKAILKGVHEKTGSDNQAIKIKAGKLIEKGIKESADKLIGKDLVIEQAGDFDINSFSELMDMISMHPGKGCIILVDNPMQIERLLTRYPGLKDVFAIDKSVEAEIRKNEAESSNKIETAALSRQEEKHTPKDVSQMDIDTFVNCAVDYAKSIDCAISGKSKLALYQRAEIMEEDNLPLTKENAIALIEEAADRAEKPRFSFSSKYDKDGLLILKENHFLP